MNLSNSTNLVQLKTITHLQAFNLTFKIFSPFGLEEDVIRNEMRHIDLNLSRGLFVGEKLVGIYCFQAKKEPTCTFPGKGVQGVVLGVLPEYHNLGYGKILIDYSLTLNFDYIWGMHWKGLNNIDHWLKKRQLLSDCPEFYITAAKLR